MRSITHTIRSNRFKRLKNVEVGTLHVHHLVWGILLLIVTGYSAIALDSFPSREVLAVLLGVAVALTLDEFALWLHLRDVYWSREGRSSVDAVIVMAVISALLLMGLHLWIEGLERASDELQAGVAVIGAIHLIPISITLLKGKWITGVIGLFLPIVALIGAIRLAKPESLWAHRWYGEEKRGRAEQRFGKAEPPAQPADAAARA